MMFKKAAFVVLLSVAMIGCKEAGKVNQELTDKTSSEVDYEMTKMEEGEVAKQENHVTAVTEGYLAVKNALVVDDQEAAKKAGAALVGLIDEFKVDGYEQLQQQELKDIIEDAREHAQHISESDIAHQREHFQILSKDLDDLLAITGTHLKLYQVRCSMSNNGKGAIWLSQSEEIQNPYYGEKMLKCGKVEKKIG